MQLEVADEPADGRGGQAFRPGLVPDLVLERRDVGDQVGLARRSSRVDGEPARRGGKEVVAAIRVAAGLADLDERPDAGQASDRSVPTSRPSRMSTTPNGAVVSRQWRVNAR